MPCVGDEPGCDPDGSIVVRNPNDGIHFCATQEIIQFKPCSPQNSGGDRRASAAILDGMTAAFLPSG